MTTPVTAANVVDVVQNLVNALYVPGQTPQQEQSGELTFDQMRAKILQIINELSSLKRLTRIGRLAARTA